MLTKHLVVVPKSVVPRDKYDAGRLKHFEELTGIKKTRRFAGTSREFLAAGIAAVKEELDPHLANVRNVILVTQSPSRLSPCNAIDLLEPLGLDKDVAVFDVNQSCDGFIYGLYIGRALASAWNPSLVVCLDMLRFENRTEEDLIFSDGISFSIINGSFEKGHSIFRNEPNSEVLYAGVDGKMRMDGGAVFDFVTRRIPKLIKEAVAHNDAASCVPIHYVVPHQANLSMLKMIHKRSGFAGEFVYSIEEYGNQSMVSIATALAMHSEKLRMKKVLLCGFGAGFSAATYCLTFWPRCASKILEV